VSGIAFGPSLLKRNDASLFDNPLIAVCDGGALASTAGDVSTVIRDLAAAVVVYRAPRVLCRPRSDLPASARLGRLIRNHTKHQRWQILTGIVLRVCPQLLTLCNHAKMRHGRCAKKDFNPVTAPIAANSTDQLRPRGGTRVNRYHLAVFSLVRTQRASRCPCGEQSRGRARPARTTRCLNSGVQSNLSPG
jgi:hypothetical protein